MVFLTGPDGIVKKFACITCIKGHRSTRCVHSDRDLVEIKRKGRPATQCAACREARITKQAHVKCICHTRRPSVCHPSPLYHPSPINNAELSIGQGQAPDPERAVTLEEAYLAQRHMPVESFSPADVSCDNNPLSLNISHETHAETEQLWRQQEYDSIPSSVSSDGTLTPPNRPASPAKNLIACVLASSTSLGDPGLASAGLMSRRPSSLTPIHDPLDDLDSDTPIYRSYDDDVDLSDVLGEITNTPSEELLNQIYSNFDSNPEMSESLIVVGNVSTP